MSLSFAEKLINNIKEFRALESATLDSGYNKEDLIAYLQQRAARNAEIMAENNAILNDELRPLLAKEVNLTPEEAEDLFTLTQQLLDFHTSLDAGLALEIHQTLLARALQLDDIDDIVHNRYCIGFIYQQMHNYVLHHNNRLKFANLALTMYQQGAAYTSRYFDVQNKTTRKYIVRCLGNVYSMHGATRYNQPGRVLPFFLSSLNAALRFWNNEEVRAKDPDFPWETYINNAHQNMIAWLDELRANSVEQCDISLAWHISNSFDAFNKTNVHLNKFWPIARTQYTQIAIDYYTGATTQNATLNKLRDMFEEAVDDDYTDNGQFYMTRLSSYLITQLGWDKDIPEAELNKEIEHIIRRVLTYFKNVPGGVSKTEINRNIIIFMDSIMRYINFEDYIYLLLKFTSFSHLPTYVHSIQVKNITEIIAGYFQQHAPHRLPCDMELISQAALCHDINKIYYANTVALSSRKLYDFEFDIIKEHARADNLQKIDDERARCISEIIMGHHKWYDSTKGYLQNYDNRAAKYSFLIDIITVADSIDAATDTVGRSYANTLTIEQVIAEIHDQAGTRYSPEIAEALNDPALVEALRHCITEGRREAYHAAYLDISGAV